MQSALSLANVYASPLITELLSEKRQLTPSRKWLLVCLLGNGRYDCTELVQMEGEHRLSFLLAGKKSVVMTKGGYSSSSPDTLLLLNLAYRDWNCPFYPTESFLEMLTKEHTKAFLYDNRFRVAVFRGLGSRQILQVLRWLHPVFLIDRHLTGLLTQRCDETTRNDILVYFHQVHFRHQGILSTTIASMAWDLICVSRESHDHVLHRWVLGEFSNSLIASQLLEKKGYRSIGSVSQDPWGYIRWISLTLARKDGPQAAIPSDTDLAQMVWDIYCTTGRCAWFVEFLFDCGYTFPDKGGNGEGLSMELMNDRILKWSQLFLLIGDRDIIRTVHKRTFGSYFEDIDWNDPVLATSFGKEDDSLRVFVEGLTLVKPAREKKQQ